MIAKAKAAYQTEIERIASAEADALFAAIDSQVVEPEERPRDSLSAPEIPACNRQLSVIEIKDILNNQIPKTWRKQISGVVWD